jgi:GH24 family phage-related lysozyme (muramidase)
MNAHLKLTQAGANLIQHFEGCLKKQGEHYHAYKCPAGVWTIGWGSTHHGGHKIGTSTRWTLEECNQAFLKDMEAFERDVRKLVRVPLEAHHFDALVSFHYNTGALGKSTLLKKLNAGDFGGAASEFLKWNKAGGKVLSGLTRRRASESLLFQNIPDENYDGKADPKPPKHPMPQAIDSPEDQP